MEEVGPRNAAAQASSLRRHDPDQVQRVRLTAVSAPKSGHPSRSRNLSRKTRSVNPNFFAKLPCQISVNGLRLAASDKKGQCLFTPIVPIDAPGAQGS
jgi:hypothetical protein